LSPQTTEIKDNTKSGLATTQNPNSAVKQPNFGAIKVGNHCLPAYLGSFDHLPNLLAMSFSPRL
jgi:hypothetical protein